MQAIKRELISCIYDVGVDKDTKNSHLYTASQNEN